MYLMGFTIHLKCTEPGSKLSFRLYVTTESLIDSTEISRKINVK